MQPVPMYVMLYAQLFYAILCTIKLHMGQIRPLEGDVLSLLLCVWFGHHDRLQAYLSSNRCSFVTYLSGVMHALPHEW
jgi:hypothetical protein